jgi:hypothetical protein
MTETLHPYGSIAEVRERTRSHDANRRAVFEAQTASAPITANTRPLGIPDSNGSVVAAMNELFDAKIAAAPIETRAAVRVEVERERAEWLKHAEAVAAKHERIRANALKGIV